MTKGSSEKIGVASQGSSRNAGKAESVGIPRHLGSWTPGKRLGTKKVHICRVPETCLVSSRAAATGGGARHQQSLETHCPHCPPELSVTLGRQTKAEESSGVLIPPLVPTRELSQNKASHSSSTASVTDN